MSGWVILATDTGVGKTHIGSRLVAASQIQTAPLFPLKPVETGCQPVNPQQRLQTSQPLWPEDGAALATACAHQYPLDEICPLRFSTPAAAPEAARAEETSLWFKTDLAPILDTQRPQPQLIETAGGLYSPVCEDALNIDIAQYCQLPVILITPDRLGTISATLSAIEVILNRGLCLDAVLLNTRPEDQATAHQPDNLNPIRDWCNHLFPDWRGQILVFTDGHTALSALNKINTS